MKWCRLMKYVGCCNNNMHFLFFYVGMFVFVCLYSYSLSAWANGIFSEHLLVMLTNSWICDVADLCCKNCVTWFVHMWCCTEIPTCGWWSVVWAKRRQRQLLWWESSLRTSSLMRYELRRLLFYYENRTQGTLKTIKKNKEQSTTG